MNVPTFARLVLPLACMAAVPAQITLPINPAATYYRTDNDPFALDSYSVPIWAFGVVPGDWILIGSVGDYGNGVSGDVLSGMVGVFSTDNTLLAGSNQQRVPGAVATGTSWVFPWTTAVSSLSMEIAQDFYVSRDGFAHEVIVQVPPGGRDLFLCVPDAFYGDNTDPDGDFGVQLWLAPPPVRPGTGEDLQVWTGVDATQPVWLPEVRTAAAGSTIHAEIHHPLDTQTSHLFLLVADLAATGSTPTGPLPNTWFGLTAVVALGIGPLPSGFVSWSIAVPPGMAGTSLFLQAGTLWPQARNGLFVASNSHEIRLQ